MVFRSLVTSHKRTHLPTKVLATDPNPACLERPKSNSLAIGRPVLSSALSRMRIFSGCDRGGGGGEGRHYDMISYDMMRYDMIMTETGDWTKSSIMH